MNDWIIFVPRTGAELAFVGLTLIEAFRLAETTARNNGCRVRLELER